MPDSTTADVEVESVELLLRQVAEDSRRWKRSPHVRPWFRGQADAALPLLPKLFRGKHDEFWMNSIFRLKAPAFGPVPETSRIDQWLFLAQHFGLPTRLLDWTESPIVACLFAVEQWAKSEKPEESYKSPHMAVWMLHPTGLNALSRVKGFPNTWVKGNVGNEMFRQAFHPENERASLIVKKRLRPTRLPLAVQASAVDRRVVVQRSCFTIHGTDERDFATMLEKTTLRRDGQFKRFLLPRAAAPALLEELVDMGVSFSTVYPDFSGLADELKFRFGPKPVHKHVAD